MKRLWRRLDCAFLHCIFGCVSSCHSRLITKTRTRLVGCSELVEQWSSMSLGPAFRSMLPDPAKTLWTVVCMILALSSLVPTSISQKTDGFISINCGGDNFTDSETNIKWITDDSYLDSAERLAEKGLAIPAAVNLDQATAAIRTRDNAEALKTAMTFIPSVTSPSKYCYILPLSDATRNYLLRVMFPNSDMRPKTPSRFNVSVSGHGTRFNLSVDSTIVSTIDLHPKKTLTMELVVFPVDDYMHVCLVPLEGRSSMPAISSIELRPLPDEMYMEGGESTLGATDGQTNIGPRNTAGTRKTYLKTISRLNFGGDEHKPAVRFPSDPYDRLWYAPSHAVVVEIIGDVYSKNITGNTSTDSILGNQFPNFRYPVEVVKSAWVSNWNYLSFGLNVSSLASFYLSMCFYDVRDRSVDFDSVEVDVSIDSILDSNSRVSWSWPWGSNIRLYSNMSRVWWNYRQTFPNDPIYFQIIQTANSTGPPMINALELYGEFEAQVPYRTDQDYVSTIRRFYSFVKDRYLIDLDTTGDPCYPVPWNWLLCNSSYLLIEINLSSKGIKGTLPSDLTDIPIHLPTPFTTLDLSDNGLYGNLPLSFVPIPWSTLILDNNNLTGFNFSSVVNNSFGSYPDHISLRNNRFSGSVSPFIDSLLNNGGSEFKPIQNLYLGGNEFSGPIPLDVGKLTSLQQLDLSNNQFTGNLPTELFQLTDLQILYLGGNELSGPIPSEVENLKYLQEFDLSNNQLTGNLPTELFQLITDSQKFMLQDNLLTGMVRAEIWKAESNSTINLDNNRFTGLNLSIWCERLMFNATTYSDIKQNVSLIGNDISSVVLPLTCRNFSFSEPSSHNWKQNGFILLGGNPWCTRFKGQKRTQVERYLCRSDPSEDFWNPDLLLHADSKRLLLIMGTIGGVVILFIICFLLVFIWRFYKRMRTLRQIQEALAKEDVRPPFFRYDELKASTKNFSDECALGKGAFGAVYKAIQADGSTVAVKKLFPTKQNITDFLKEMVLITGIKHKNLIQLKGCCVRDNKRLLVYEYAENRSLAEALWDDTDPQNKLTWQQRVQICIGVARGLSYLHEELQPRIIHRDIKPQNILLDKDWNARIADFGLARPAHEDTEQFATSIGGTLGYFSPEYATLGILSEKLDVYSYGVLVLEIISGRRCINFSLPEDEVYLKNWAFKLYSENRLEEAAEESLSATVSRDEILVPLKLALSCLQENPDKRPSMSQVVATLLGSSSNLAIDIVNELKDQQFPRLRGLLDSSSTVKNIRESPDLESEERALLPSTILLPSSQEGIEMSLTIPR